MTVAITASFWGGLRPGATSGDPLLYYRGRTGDRLPADITCARAILTGASLLCAARWRRCTLRSALAAPVSWRAICPRVAGSWPPGAPGARVMVIGQAPGRITVERGLMFGGPSGAALERWLQRAGFAPGALRREVYLSALTRCDPGRSPTGKGDRKPSPAEVALCRPWLEASWRSCARALSCWWVAWPSRRFWGRPSG